MNLVTHFSISKSRDFYDIKQVSSNLLNIDLDSLVAMVEGYRQRVYNEDMMAIDKSGGKNL
jgi:hypothetical protein